MIEEHKLLQRLKKRLNNFFCYFKHPNVLVIAEDKSVLPFAFFIIDEHYPDNILLSLAVDYPHCNNAVAISLIANTMKKVKMSDSFFIAQDGHTYFNQAAERQYQLEVDLPLDELEPLTDTIN